MAESQTSEEFITELRSVLQNLYDPARLNRSACVQLFGVEQRNNPAAALRRVLLDSIEALKPGTDVPPHSAAWRVYHVLTWRYVEQSSQNAVAANLSVSPRQLRRLEWDAIRVLADYLQKRYAVSDKPLATEHPASTPGNTIETHIPGATQELAWVQDSFPNETDAIDALLDTALKTVAPLMNATGTKIDCRLSDGLPLVTGQLVALRQGLLNLLTGAIRAIPGGMVNIDVSPHQRGIEVRLWVTAADSEAQSGLRNAHDVSAARVASAARNASGEHFEMARQFVCLFGGTLDVLVATDAAEVVASMVLPVVEQTVVLVVDDNADTLRLLERHLAGTRYRFVGTHQPEQVIPLAEEVVPDIILLDIMLPGIDGWELLGRLREHPQLAGVPIVVSTILPQDKLALTLGAADFVRKPFSRETLLAVLDRQQQPCD